MIGHPTEEHEGIILRLTWFQILLFFNDESTFIHRVSEWEKSE